MSTKRLQHQRRMLSDLLHGLAGLVLFSLMFNTALYLYEHGLSVVLVVVARLLQVVWCGASGC